MSISYSDHQTAMMCPDCYAIPCRCSRLTLLIEGLIRWLEQVKRRRYDKRQHELGVQLEPDPFAGVPYCGGYPYCVYRNEHDERHPRSGFYGVCWKCGVTYDPGCDR